MTGSGTTPDEFAQEFAGSGVGDPDVQVRVAEPERGGWAVSTGRGGTEAARAEFNRSIRTVFTA